nr:serine/threonine-protein kinase [Bifidobacterium actinocoloniiforme]
MSRVDVLNLQTGDEVGGYTLIAPLGGGAMGSVWRVQDDGGTDYAMKVLRDSLAEKDGQADGQGGTDRASARERLRREAMSLRRIDHPGVCRIVDMELDDSLAFIVTELIEGLNLSDDVSTNGAYSGDDLERLAAKLIDAVAAVHRAGIVHRDIKPTNVMISAAGPVLVDFGIAMGAGEAHVTRTGLVMGTPGFIAPEVIDGAESDEESDWWSTAAVLAYAACGKPVFGSQPMMAVLERAASGSADLTGLPARTMAAFRAALSPRRQDRPRPQALLDAIGLDALQPELWERDDEPDDQQDSEQGEDSGESGQSQPGDEESEGVVRPFGASSSTDRRPGPSGGAQASGVGDARNLTAGETTQVLGGPASNPRLTWRTQNVDTARTQALADSGPEDATTLAGLTRTLPAKESELGATADWDEAEDGAEDDAEKTWVGGPSSATRTLPAMTTALPAEVGGPSLQAGTMAQAAPRIAPEAAVPGQYAAPATPYGPYAQAPLDPPAAVRWRERYKRGRPVLWMIGLLAAALAALTPFSACLLSSLALWALATAGLSLGGQMSRELKRGDGRRRRDALLNLASLPWLAIKALAMTLPRLLILLTTDALGLAAGGWLLGTPKVSGKLGLFGAVIPLPLVAGKSSSAAGLLAATCALVGWLLAAFAGGGGGASNSATAPGTKDWRLAVRLGAGALPGKGAQEREAEQAQQAAAAGLSGQADPLQGTPAQASRRRPLILLALWVLILGVLLAFIASGTTLDWAPITLMPASS